MAQGYNFGVDPEEVVLTLVGFASQHEIFNLMSFSSQSDLGWVAYAFGLIGFLMLLLLPGSWNFKAMASWSVLFLIIIIRPLGEVAFFSDAASVAESTLNAQACITGQTDTEECRAVMERTNGENMENFRVRDLVGSQRLLYGENDNTALSFKVYTPEAAAIDVINDLNYALAVGLNNLGPRALERHFSSIETLRRAATSDTPTAYNISEFLATCGRKVPGAADVAYMRSDDIQTQHADVWNGLEDAELSAADAVVLYQNYANYVRGMELSDALRIYPTLVCEPGACAGNNAYDQSTISRRISPSEFEEALGPISFNGQYEEMSSRKKQSLGLTSQAIGDLDLGGRIILRQQEIGDTLNDLNVGIGSLGDNAFRRLDEQKVSLVVPMNVTSAEMNDLESAEDMSIHNHTVGSRLVDEYGPACLVGGAAGAVVGGPIGAAAGCVLGAGTAWIFGWQNETPRINQDMQMRPIIDGDEPGFVVSNCQQLHRVIDVRNALSTSRTSQFETDFSRLQDQYPDAFDNSDPEFAALPPRAQAHSVMTTALALVPARCDRISMTDFAKNRCIRDERERIQSMIVLNRNLVASASHPAAQAMVQNAAEPEFQGGLRNVAAWAGEQLAPVGVAVKAAIGGFGAGTYSKIMPMVVTYATVIMIILTPIIYMVGLAVPSWSFGILFMPLVVIVYFQLTKIVFTMIGIINGIFLATNDQNMLTGNMIGFADLVMGFAYTSAFILTGFFMFALKNPVGAIQQVAGTADKTSTISGQEAIGMALGAAKIAKTVVAGPKALASGIGAAKGAASMGQGIGGTLNAALGSMSSSSAEGNTFSEIMGNSEEKAMEKIAYSDQSKEARKSRTPEDYRAIAAGKFQKMDEENTRHFAKGDGQGKHFKDTSGLSMVGDRVTKVPADNGGSALEGALQKSGEKAGEALINTMKRGKLNDMYDTKSTYRDSEGKEYSGSVVHDFDMSKMPDINFDKLAAKGQGSFVNANGEPPKQGEKATHFRIVAHKGVESGQMPKGGGGDDLVN